MNNSILVSINCITYNHEKYIAQAIEGFLMQKTNFEYEIIIGEDCSTDGTRAIVQKYINKYPDKIKMITSDKNVGARNNDNRVFNASVGKYIAYCEGDDYWIDEYKLQKQVDYIENNENCSMVFHNTKYFNDKSKKFSVVNKVKSGKYNIGDVIVNGGGFIPTASILYRKHIMNNPPDFYTKGFVGDYPLQMLCALNGYVYCIDDFMSVYRTNVDGSWSSQCKKINKEKLIKRYQGIIDILDMFNKYTKFSYDKFVNEAKLPLEFEIYLFESNKIRFNKYNKFLECYNNLSKRKRIKTLFKGNFTDTYIYAYNLKVSIKEFIKKLLGWYSK